MSNILTLAASKVNPMPADFAAELRALADRIDAGEIKAFVGMAVAENYESLFPSSLQDSLELASLLQARCVARFGVS